MADLSLDPQKTALVAIDLQNAVVSRSVAPHSVQHVMKKNRQIAEALRVKGGLVVWVRVDLNQFMKLPVDQAPYILGQNMPEELSQIAPSAGFQTGDALITKKHWGAFAQTSLEQDLKDRGIDTVVLTGIATNIGVESTLRQGTGLGFAFIVVEDACSGQSAEDHRFAFANIFSRLARVRSTEEVLKAIV